jgi:hypothetical protein
VLTKTEALDIVSKELQKRSSSDDPFVVVEEDTIEMPFGWVFFYNSKAFLDTGVFSYRLAGNGPVILNKHDGTFKVCGTDKSVEELIEDYEKKLTESQGK